MHPVNRKFDDIKLEMPYSIKIHADLECPNCKNSIELYWDSKYNGLRGRCITCLTNWPES